MRSACRLFFMVIWILLLWGISDALPGTDLVWWELENAGDYINKYNDPTKDVSQVRNERNLLMTALGKPKRIVMRRCFPESTEIVVGDSRGYLPIQVRVWVKAPNENITVQNLSMENGHVIVEVPRGPAMNGFYIVASSINAGIMDINGDGNAEKTYLCPKSIIGHWQFGSEMETDKPLSLNTSEVPLEIVPLRASRYIGTIQVALRSYRMKVLYRGKPAAGAKVTVLTERGWQKSWVTNEKAVFEIVPLEGKTWERYLYAAVYHDLERHESYVATLPMLVDPPWPVWRSWHGVLIFWTIFGVGFLLLVIAAGFYINLRRKKAVSSRFEKYRKHTS